LENLLNSKSDAFEKGIILRTITQLCYYKKDKNSEDYKNLLKYIQLTTKYIQTLGSKEVFKKDEENELNWFYSITWNESIELSKQNKFDLSYQFMQLSYIFLTNLRENIENL
jgi:hypothetical protein